MRLYQRFIHLPEIHRGVGAPWPPEFGSLRELPHIAQRRSAQQTQVTRRKRVGIAQSPHRDVLRGPVSNARQSAERRSKLIDIDGRIKIDLLIGYSTRQ